MEAAHKYNPLVEGPVAPTLFRFALPFMLSSLLQSLYGAADLFVVGQYSGAAAVSGVSIGSQLMQTVTALVLALSMGGTVLIGNRIGEKDYGGAARAIGTTAVLFALIAAVMTPVMLLCTDLGVALMQTPEEAAADCAVYVRICSAGLPFIVGYNALSGIFRGLGDSKTPVLFVAVACAVNIGADLLLVGVLRMGAAGAAAATITAQGLSFFAALIYMGKKGFGFPFSRREHLRLDKPSAKRILKVGAPLALQSTATHLSFMIISAIINTMGLIASAAVGVAEKIIAFAFLPPDAFASGVAAMTAQNLGAGQPRRALDSLKWGILFSLVSGTAVCVFANLFPSLLPAIFTPDEAVIRAAGDYLQTYTIDCVLVSFVFCFNNYFSGCGRAMISMTHNIIATFAVRIPVTVRMSRVPGGSLTEMGLAAPAASFLSILICTGYFLWLKKKEKNEQKEPENG